MALDYKRSAQELEKELTFARGELTSEADPSYAERLSGIVAALEWALGREAVAPASSRVAPSPDWREQHREQLWAEEIEEGVRPLPAGTSTHKAGGIAAALTWSSGYTNVTPS
jgi:hypothetical protein